VSSHVATAMSKRGGPCKDCGQHIEQGESIFKFAAPNESPSKGQKNGPGVWVCLDCMVRREGYVPSLDKVSGTQETLL